MPKKATLSHIRPRAAVAAAAASAGAGAARRCWGSVLRRCQDPVLPRLVPVPLAASLPAATGTGSPCSIAASGHRPSEVRSSQMASELSLAVHATMSYMSKPRVVNKSSGVQGRSAVNKSSGVQCTGRCHLTNRFVGGKGLGVALLVALGLSVLRWCNRRWCGR